ncbi:MAG: Trm112 family protein [candidate division Zixibacteria bacterium]|nr:Trm112 family protein [candidate division Zixibacteria bacterium]
MALSRELLNIIVCPKCKGQLDYSGSKNTLCCNICRLFYRVENDIPRLLLEEAKEF